MKFQLHFSSEMTRNYMKYVLLLFGLYPPTEICCKKIQIFYSGYVIASTCATVARKMFVLGSFVNEDPLPVVVIVFIRQLIISLTNIIISTQIICQGKKIGHLLNILQYMDNKYVKFGKSRKWTKLFILGYFLLSGTRFLYNYIMLTQTQGFLYLLNYHVTISRIELMLTWISLLIVKTQIAFAFTNANLRLSVNSLEPILTCIDNINETFGIIIAMAVFLYTATLLFGLVSLVIAINDASTSFILEVLMYFVLSGVYIFTLATLGEQLINEKRISITICYQMCQRFNHLSAFKERKLMQSRFLAISQQLHQRSTTLDAAGFFAVAHTMIIFILTNVCTFLIVATQML